MTRTVSAWSSTPRSQAPTTSRTPTRPTTCSASRAWCSGPIAITRSPPSGPISLTTMPANTKIAHYAGTSNSELVINSFYDYDGAGWLQDLVHTTGSYLGSFYGTQASY